MVSPGWACSLASARGDCCPAGTSSPCTGEGLARRLQGAPAACCTSGLASSAVAIDSSGTLREHDHHPNSSPDQFVLVGSAPSRADPVLDYPTPPVPFWL